MALSDPQSITVTAGTVSLPRTGAGLDAGTFTSADGQYLISVRHAYNKRTRRVFRVDAQKKVVNDLLPSQNMIVKYSAYLVLDVPVNGVSSLDATDLIKALMGNLSASTFANTTKFVGGES